jgi:hypothetical protein
MAEMFKELDPEAMTRSPGLTYQDLLDQDTHEVPAVLRLQSPRDVGLNEFSIDRYITREYHDKEVEHLWMKVWQFACREEEIPEPGDHLRYDIAGRSFLVVRQFDGSIKTYPNACLHRGDGCLKEIPADWDFPQIDHNDFGLPEIPTDTWAGFVFINPDQNCEPLAPFIKDLAEQFVRWDLGSLYIQAHVARIVPCNWKIAQEHPQILRSLGDTNSQVDIWDNCARVITPGGTPSPLLDYEVSDEDILRAMMDLPPDAELPPLPEGSNARSFLAAMSREGLRSDAGDRVDAYCDAEIVDSIDYTQFPNFHPWGAFNKIVYRFRPNGNDHRSAIMECYQLMPFEGERPPAAPIHWLGPDEKWSSVLGFLGRVFDQDLFNMPNVQMGLESTYKPGVSLSAYQEGKVRWLHHKLTEWVGE